MSCPCCGGFGRCTEYSCPDYGVTRRRGGNDLRILGLRNQTTNRLVHNIVVNEYSMNIGYNCI